MCTLVTPSFTIDIKVGCKGVIITRTCFRDNVSEVRGGLNYTGVLA